MTQTKDRCSNWRIMKSCLKLVCFACTTINYSTLHGEIDQILVQCLAAVLWQFVAWIKQDAITTDMFGSWRESRTQPFIHIQTPLFHGQINSFVIVIPSHAMKFM